MHFYHQDNVLCTPPKWFHANVEVALTLYLPREMPPLSSNCEVTSGYNNKDDEPSVPCWSVSGGESEANHSGTDGPPHVVHVDSTTQPQHTPQLMSLKPKPKA
jgi:hypothetical protein